MNFRGFLFAFFAMTSIALTAAAHAQDFPKRAVRIVVPSAAGGGTDLLMRALAVELSERWGQPVIVDNRPGAAGFIGAANVAGSPPDGYTLFASTDTVMVANRFLFKSLPYDPDKSFAPVALLAQANQMLLTLPAVPAADLKEFVALAKREKGKYSYGSYGVGSQPHLAYEMLNRREGLDLVHVPYKGIAPVLGAMAGGEVQLTMGSAAVASKLLAAGKLKALAVAAGKRDPRFPDLKTTTELGFPYLQISIWQALFTPAGTPDDIVRKLSADVLSVFGKPGFAEKHADGWLILAGGPAELAERIKRDLAVTREMISVAGIQPE